MDKEIADRIALPIGDLIWLLLDKAYSRKEKITINVSVVLKWLLTKRVILVHIDITGDVVTDRGTEIRQ